MTCGASGSRSSRCACWGTGCSIVELEFETAPGSPVETGQVIGWLEGFKAVTDIFSPLAGRFEGSNLGEIVELEFETAPGSPVETGQVIGWLEGFKAVTDIFSPLAGRFEGSNPAVDDKVTLLTTDPYRRGWLFKVQGQPGDECLDVHAYVSLLDTTIDKMLGQRHE